MYRSTRKAVFVLGTIMAVSFLALGIVSATAISLSQSKAQENLVWAQGSWFNYSLTFLNTINPGVNNSNPEYFPTVNVTATVLYNITSFISPNANITETISNISIIDPYAANASNKPFLCEYNNSVSLTNYTIDFYNEVHGNGTIGVGYPDLIPRYSTTNMTITNGSFPVPTIVNNYTVNLIDGNASVQSGSQTVINRFLVSSNISDNISTINSTLNKTTQYALFYTPMAFAMAGQNGSFLMFLPESLNLTLIDDYGLWATTNPAYSMGGGSYNPYTVPTQLSIGQSQPDYRWDTAFGITYPKIGTWESAQFDQATGIMISYTTKQTTWSGNVSQTIYSGVMPQQLSFNLESFYLPQMPSGQQTSLPANSTAPTPGYPVLVLIASLGAGLGIIWMLKRKELH
jgi:hypothetical protein